MAKRIKVKGTPPSSTRKKLVKEGSRKFIGPRQLQGELAEVEITASRDRSSPHRDRSRESTAAERREDREHNRYLLREMRKKSDPFTEGLSPKVRKRLLDFVNSKMKSAGIPGSGSKYQEDLIRAVDASGWFAGIYDKPRSKR